jgi:hypothetical protein
MNNSLKNQNMNNKPFEQVIPPAVAVNMKREPVQKLSDEAFYLIVLASQLKKMIYPATLNQFLVPGSFAGFNNDPLEGI